MIANLGHGHTAEWFQGDKFIVYRDEKCIEYDWVYLLGVPNYMNAWKAFYARETGNYS